MPNVLVPVQDERDAPWAAEQAIKVYRYTQARIHLLNVQRPLPQHVSRFFSPADLRDFHLENGQKRLQPVIDRLQVADVPHKVHVLIGHEAETIVHFAQEYHCSRVLMEERPNELLAVLGLGAISSQVSHLMRTRNLAVAVGAA